MCAVVVRKLSTKPRCLVFPNIKFVYANGAKKWRDCLTVKAASEASDSLIVLLDVVEEFGPHLPGGHGVLCRKIDLGIKAMRFDIQEFDLAAMRAHDIINN